MFRASRPHPAKVINTGREFHPFTEFNKLVQQQQLLDGQYNENKNVLEELQLLKPTNTVRVDFELDFVHF